MGVNGHSVNEAAHRVTLLNRYCIHVGWVKLFRHTRRMRYVTSRESWACLVMSSAKTNIHVHVSI